VAPSEWVPSSHTSLPSHPWQGRILPLNHTRNLLMSFMRSITYCLNSDKNVFCHPTKPFCIPTTCANHHSLCRHILTNLCSNGK